MQDHYFTRDFSLDNLPNDPVALMGTSQVRPDGKTIPQFFKMQERDEARTAALGTVKYLEIEMVRIFIPGDKHNVVERRVNDDIRARYPKQYDAWKKTEELAPDGTLIDNWPLLSRAQVFELKAANIFTLEQLGDVSDNALGNIGIGARQLRAHARAYLEAAQTGKVSSTIISENQALKDQVAMLVTQIGDLSKRLELSLARSGDRPENERNPVLESKINIARATGVDVSIQIPKEYTGLGLPKLKELVAQFYAGPCRTKDEAIELIAEYIGKQKAIAA